jgi:predicted metal-dependent hydrolase
MASNVHSASTVGIRTLTTRRPHFEYGERLSQRHFVGGDLLSSHLFAVLSTLIPEGERFVVDAVKRYRTDVDDPVLKKQANALVGQESMHQREHERLNEVLGRMGYPTWIIGWLGTPWAVVGRRFAQPTQLAASAAIEHWTAVLSEQALEQRRARPGAGPLGGDEEVQAFVTWHYIEEIEHKSVAFDVMQSLGATEEQRIDAMKHLIRLMAPLLGVSMVVSLAADPAAWNPWNLWRSLQWMRTNHTIGQQGFMDAISEWDREGFHPDQRDHGALLAYWQAEAFGEGSIVERRSQRGVCA